MTSRLPFYGSALRLGRTFAGLTQAELGERVGVTRQYVHQLEAAGHRERTDVLVEAFAEVLGVQADFFSRRPHSEVNDEVCHFRRRSTTPLHVRNRVLAQGSLFQQVVAYLDETLKLPPVRVPHLDVENVEDIELSAERCRKEWQIPLDAPIGSITRLLENVGAVVTTFSGVTAKVDAFSWSGDRPIIVRRVHPDSPSRTRYDLAHECGHLVMHLGRVTGDAETEDQANRFAGALLLPRRGFIREFPRGKRIKWAQMFELKQRWGTSVQAMIRRAYDLRLIDATRYRSAFVQISRNGWKKKEPHELEEERPELVALAFRQLAERLSLPPSRVAADLGLSVDVLERVVGFPLTPLETPPGVIPLGRRRLRNTS